MNKLLLAGCIIPNDEGKILLIHRQTSKRQQWEVPGGKVEDGEIITSTAIREIKEEIGVEVTLIKELGTKDFKEDGFVLEYTWFLAKISQGEAKIIEVDKFDGMGYFSWNELIENKGSLSPNTINLLEEYLAGRINLS